MSESEHVLGTLMYPLNFTIQNLLDKSCFTFRVQIVKPVEIVVYGGFLKMLEPLSSSRRKEKPAVMSFYTSDFSPLLY